MLENHSVALYLNAFPIYQDIKAELVGNVVQLSSYVLFFSSLSYIRVLNVEKTQCFLVTYRKAVNYLYQTVDVISSGKVKRDTNK